MLTPDTKDWTWVLDRPCPDCGFDARAVEVADLPELLRVTTLAWSEVLRAAADVRARPSEDVWSVLEYACHVRDVHRLFDVRLQQMLAEDNPTFANWDQDATAVEDDYGSQDPTQVEIDLIEAAGTIAGHYSQVTAEQLERRGLRSDGSEFTVTTFGRYHLHDIVHHVYDVGYALRGTGTP